MTPEQLTYIGVVIASLVAVITAAHAVIKAAREALPALGGFVEDAKELWHGLKTNNKDTAVIKGLLDRMRKMQIDQDEIDRLRRWYAAYQSHPDCQGGCRDAIEQMVDDRRIRPLNPPRALDKEPTH